MNIDHRACMLAACSCIVAAAANGTGYLSSGGPAPLRFQSKVATVGQPMLPPLPVPTAGSKVSTPPALINSNATATVTTAESPTPVGAALVATNGFELTPQMLVDIFRSRAESGNGHDTRVLVPFGFVPPIGQPQPAGPAASGTSTATYQVQ
jgi:hypothetical protein